MPFESPAEDDFAAACRVVSSYIGHPDSGRDTARSAQLRKLIGEWSFTLTDVERCAAYEMEKS
jgi:hypothetical protein